MKDSLIQMALERAPNQCITDNIDLENQRAEKKRKRDLIKEKNLDKSTSDHIDAWFYYEKYYSTARWKTKKQIDREISTITTKTDRLKSLKIQINIYVKGLGWNDVTTPWSKNGKAFDCDYLKNHLKNIITQTKRRNITPPQLQIPQRKRLPTLGTKSKDIINFDAKNEEVRRKLEINAIHVRQDRELHGTLDSYQNLQPTSMSEIKKGMRLDVLCNYNDSEKETDLLTWCQGKVIEVRFTICHYVVLVFIIVSQQF